LKSKTNLFLLISFLIALGITAWAYYQTTHRVGELQANEKNGENFKACNEEKITEYYGMDNDYIGGKTAIKNGIFNKLQSLNFEESGLVTFRFVINCEGKIGRFSVKSTNRNLQKIKIYYDNISEIEKALAELKNWSTAKNKSGNNYDHYYILNFKIDNKKIVDIF
jgi:hypothetical protein